MPSLPTSLVIVGLVAAWLVVLVPMVSRRREEVPENEEGTASFRVLERREKRRRPVLARTAMAARGDGGALDGEFDDAGVGEEFDGVDVRDEFDGGTVDGFGEADLGERTRGGIVRGGAARQAVAHREGVRGEDVYGEHSRGEDSRGRVGGAEYSTDATGFDAQGQPNTADEDAPADLTDELVDDSADGWYVDRTFADSRGRRRRTRDGSMTAEEPEAERAHDRVQRRSAVARGREHASGRPSRDRGLQPQRVEVRAGWDLGNRADADRSDAPPRSAVRAGRGGFDPQAADRARQDRFRRRRRTALVLLLAAIAGAAIGALGIGYGYIAAVSAGALLVLYFAYLRRQVRIEEEIRVRRAARLERARSIRPQYRPSVAEQVWMHRTGEVARPGIAAVGEYRPRSHVRPTVPPPQYGVGVPVDLDDSDPAFDELEYYHPPVRRRRAS